jgi:hypothetical protein
VVTQQQKDPVSEILLFLSENRIQILNVAGPRASEDPQGGEWAYQILLKTLEKDATHSATHETVTAGKNGNADE